MEQHFHQGQVVLFSAGKNIDFFENVVTGKQKRSQQGAGGLFGLKHVDAVLRERIRNGVVAISDRFLLG